MSVVEVSASPARAEGLPQIAGLLAQLYDAELPGALSGSREAQRRLLQFTLEARGGRGLRRRYVLAVARRGRPPGGALIHGVVVDAGQRGRGLGAALVGAVEGEIRSAGLDTAILPVPQAHRPAHRLYLRLGYQVAWEFPRHLRAIAWRTYLMRKGLTLQ